MTASNLHSIAALVGSVLVSGVSVADDGPERLPAACESALALSAAPEHLREGAGLYLFGEAGYQQARAADNGFTCLVNRDHPRVLKPTCFDAEGTRTVVPKILEVGELLAAGASSDHIRQQIEQSFARGELSPPGRPGVAYMLSHYNRPWNPRTQTLGWFPPHLMFYGADLTSTDIGFDPRAALEEPFLPLIGYQGPHGFMIVRTERRARPWAHPLPQCPDWVMGRHAVLPAESRQFDFWLGEWDVNLMIRQQDGSWPDSVAAKARIYPVLEGKAVLELWDSEPIKGYSLRYYDPGLERWVLWLNWPGRNRSGGSSLTGGFRHGRGEFLSESQQADGSSRITRYTFSDITPRSLRWDDALSSDGGTTWTHGWRMEFTRRAWNVSLPAAGGDAHTYHSGGRCDLEPFRRFEALAGEHVGIVEVRGEGGAWKESTAELLGHRILDGCSVLATLRYEVDGGSFESLSLLTWNTFAQSFEEDLLDSRPDSPLHVLYGQESEGVIELVRSEGRSPTAAAPRRHRWRLGEQRIELEVATSHDGGATWQQTLRVRLGTRARAPGV